MSEFDDILRKTAINLDTGEPYTEAEWKIRDAEVAAERERSAFEERNEAWKARKLRLVEAGLAERHLGELFSRKVEENPAIRKVAQITDDGVFVMSGNVGCGKTFAAHVWLLDAMNVPPLEWKSSGIRFVTASWFARASRYEGDKFALCQSARKLVIDDLGVEYADSKQNFLVDLDELLDLRWRKGCPTLVTTNLVMGEFKERYGQRIYDRSRGEDRWMNVKHESMRGRR